MADLVEKMMGITLTQRPTAINDSGQRVGSSEKADFFDFIDEMTGKAYSSESEDLRLISLAPMLSPKAAILLLMARQSSIAVRGLTLLTLLNLVPLPRAAILPLKILSIVTVQVLHPSV
jgi:hypothetical protein